MTQAVTVVTDHGTGRSMVFRGALVAGQLHAIARVFLEDGGVDNEFSTALRAAFGRWSHRTYALAFNDGHAELTFSHYIKPPVLHLHQEVHAILPSHASNLRLRVTTTHVADAPPVDPPGFHLGHLH